MVRTHLSRGGPIVVDAADLPESLRAQLQALESARSRKRNGADGGDGDEEDEDDDDDDHEPALVCIRDNSICHAARSMRQCCCCGPARKFGLFAGAVAIMKWRNCCRHSLLRPRVHP